MSCIYAMSDIHGCLGPFKESLKLVDFSNKANKLILLGDYLDRQHAHPEVLTYFMKLQHQHPEQIVCLMGNHEEDYLREMLEAGALVLKDETEVSYLRRPDYSAPLKDAETFLWLSNLPPHFETENQIYVHAGIDEDAGDLWKHASENWYFMSKFPWVEGSFYKDIIAGHVGTSQIRRSYGMPSSYEVFWDGKSHYYIDGTAVLSKHVPLLKYDTETCHYTTFINTSKQKNSFPKWKEIPVICEFT